MLSSGRSFPTSMVSTRIVFRKQWPLTGRYLRLLQQDRCQQVRSPCSLRWFWAQNHGLCSVWSSWSPFLSRHFIFGLEKRTWVYCKSWGQFWSGVLGCGCVAQLDIVSDVSTREGVFFQALPIIFCVKLYSRLHQRSGAGWLCSWCCSQRGWGHRLPSR